ncbi:MAG: o-succinylbenzoate synthase, partial [Actinomycetota bacterium]
MHERELTVVRVDTDLGPGWGECSALPDPTYTNEFAAGAFRQLATELGPAIVGRTLGAEDPWFELRAVCPEPDRHPMAMAALEMAVIDARLRAAGRSLAAHLAGPDGPPTTVAAGAAIGLGSIADIAASAARLADEGFGRLKLKVEPGHDLAAVAAVCEAAPDVELHVDGNGS